MTRSLKLARLSRLAYGHSQLPDKATQRISPRRGRVWGIMKLVCRACGDRACVRADIIEKAGAGHSTTTTTTTTSTYEGLPQIRTTYELNAGGRENVQSLAVIVLDVFAYNFKRRNVINKLFFSSER